MLAAVTEPLRGPMKKIEGGRYRGQVYVNRQKDDHQRRLLAAERAARDDSPRRVSARASREPAREVPIRPG